MQGTESLWLVVSAVRFLDSASATLVVGVWALAVVAWPDACDWLCRSDVHLLCLCTAFPVELWERALAAWLQAGYGLVLRKGQSTEHCLGTAVSTRKSFGVNRMYGNQPGRSRQHSITPSVKPGGCA